MLESLMNETCVERLMGEACVERKFFGDDEEVCYTTYKWSRRLSSEEVSAAQSYLGSYEGGPGRHFRKSATVEFEGNTTSITQRSGQDI